MVIKVTFLKATNVDDIKLRFRIVDFKMATFFKKSIEFIQK
jgi:hypothetical protein